MNTYTRTHTYAHIHTHTHMVHVCSTYSPRPWSREGRTGARAGTRTRVSMRVRVVRSAKFTGGRHLASVYAGFLAAQKCMTL